MIDLDRIGTSIRLCSGPGAFERREGCWMAAIRFYEGGEWSDHPDCVDDTIRELCTVVNDALTADLRNKLVGPRLFNPVGTKTDDPVTLKAIQDRCYQFAAEADPRKRNEGWWRNEFASFHSGTIAAVDAASYVYIEMEASDSSGNLTTATELLLRLIDELCEIAKSAPDVKAVPQQCDDAQFEAIFVEANRD